MIKFRYVLGSIILFLVIWAIYQYIPISEEGMKIMGVLGIIQMVYSIGCWFGLTSSMLTPYTVFLFSAYIFTFGQSFLFIFDKVTPDRDLTELFLPSALIPAQYLTLVFLNFFNIGAILSVKKTRRSYLFPEQILKNEQATERQVKGIRTVGKFFLAISIVPYIIERVKLFFIVSTLGYSGIYIQEAKVGIFNILNILSQYFIPGVLCLLLVETVRTRRNIWLLILVAEACFWLFTGGRSVGVIIASILLLYYHICVKPIEFKRAILIGVVSFFFVSLLGIVSETRTDVNADISQILKEGFGNSNAFFDALSEMGSSMYPMAATMEVVPQSEGYRNGSTYLYAASSIIPNLGFWDLHPAMKNANMNQWLQDVMNLNYGPGYSIVAEAYINFGSLGFIIMLILGFCFGRILTVVVNDKSNPLLLVLSFVFCYLIIKTVRNSFLATVRSVVYYILPIYIYVRYFVNGRIVKK